MEILIILYIVGFLRTILIIALIYYAIKLFSRYVLPLIIEKGVKNMQQKMNEQQRQYQRSARAEGEVTIETNRQHNKPKTEDAGEYVDFEEVE